MFASGSKGFETAKENSETQLVMVVGTTSPFPIKTTAAFLFQRKYKIIGNCSI